MMGDAFSPVNLMGEGGQEAKGEQARMVRSHVAPDPHSPLSPNCPLAAGGDGGLDGPHGRVALGGRIHPASSPCLCAPSCAADGAPRTRTL